MTVNNSSLATWAATIEAVIFASEKPIRESDLRNHLPDDMELAPLITMIHKRFDETSGIKLCQVGDSWAFRPERRYLVAAKTRQPPVLDGHQFLPGRRRRSVSSRRHGADRNPGHYRDPALRGVPRLADRGDFFRRLHHFADPAQVRLGQPNLGAVFPGAAGVLPDGLGAIG